MADRRPFTVFGVGKTPEEAWQSLPSGPTPPPAKVTTLVEVDVPDSVNPSKLATAITKAALDPATLEELALDIRSIAEAAARQLAESKNALAICMAGNPIGDKMKAKLGPVPPGVEAYLIFGLTDGQTSDIPAAEIPADDTPVGG